MHRFSDKSRARRLAVFLAVQLTVAAILIAAFVYRAFLDRLFPDGRRSLCLMHDLLHLYCPGCGGTRAAVALVRGRLLHSLCCNPLAIYLAVGFLVYDIRVAIAIARDEPQLPRVLARYFWGMLFLAAAHFFARNTLMIGWGYDYLGDLVTYWHP